MGKMLTFGTLFKGQNDPLDILGTQKAAKAEKAASEARARAEASRVAAEQATQNMKSNFATDLKQDNTGTVVAGGTADAVAAISADDLLKKKKTTGLSGQLGLNV